jgi:soluble lytic murein transglycosylase-like protein
LRVRHSALFLAATLAAAAVPARAEYFVLRSGQRLHVTGYQLLGEKYRLQMDGGFVELPADNVAAIEPEDVFTSAPPADAAKAPFRELIEAAAARYVVDADLITSVIAAESNFDPKAISRRNARGLMQLLPETAARLGVQNIFDPRENIDAGTRYLHDLLLLYKNDLALALAAYNAGPQRVHRYGRVPPFAETQSYVRRVRSAYVKRKAVLPDSKPGETPGPTAPSASVTPSGL